MIGTLRIKVKIEKNESLQAYPGELFHSFFFFMLKNISSSLAEMLHKRNSIKPFSLFLTEPFEKRDEKMVFKTGSVYTFDVSLLQEGIVKEFSEKLLNIPETLVYERDDISLSLESIEIKKGFTTYQNILKNAKGEKTITFEFLSPTSFRSKGKQKLFPEPVNVFDSLYKKWNTFSSLKIDEGIKKIFPEIMVVRYHLYTQLIEFSEYKIIGFKGKITYRIPDGVKKNVLKRINALADFSCFAGIGYKTTMGLGKAKRI